MPFKTKLDVSFSADEIRAELNEPLIYEHAKHGLITVPAGFETDFASVPGYIVLPGIVPRVGKIRNASVVHDWIYRGGECGRFTRAQTDRIFFDAALECDFPRWRARVAWMGVRVGGWWAWNGDRK